MSVVWCCYFVRQQTHWNPSWFLHCCRLHTHTWYNLDGGSYNLTILPVCQNCNYLQNVTVPSDGCQSCMKWFSMQKILWSSYAKGYVCDGSSPSMFFHIKPTSYSELNKNQARCAHLSTQQKLLPGLQDQSWSYMTNIWVVEKKTNPSEIAMLKLHTCSPLGCKFLTLFVSLFHFFGLLWSLITKLFPHGEIWTS